MTSAILISKVQPCPTSSPSALALLLLATKVAEEEKGEDKEEEKGGGEGGGGVIQYLCFYLLTLICPTSQFSLALKRSEILRENNYKVSGSV